MADFDLSLIVRGEDQGASATGAGVENTLNKITAAETRAGKGANELARETAAAAQAQRQLDKAAADLKAKLDPAAAAQQRLNTELAEAKTLLDTGRISATQYTAAIARLKTGQDQAARSAGAMRASSANLGQQIQDVTQQAALGVNAFVILAQQGGQVASAMSGAAGMTGRLATFLAGPIGSLVIAGTAVIGMFLTMQDKTDKAKKSKEGLTDATDALRMSSEELTKAINDQNKALDKSLQSQRDSEVQTLRNAELLFDEAARRRAVAVATLEQARALQQVNIARATGPGGTSSDVAALGLGRGSARIAELDAEVARLRGEEANAARGIAGARLKVLQRNVAEAATPEGRANRLLETQTKNLNEQYKLRLAQGKNLPAVERAYQDALLKATKEHEAAVKAIRDSKKKERAPQFEAVTSSEVAALLKAEFGGTITSTGRSGRGNAAVGGAKNSFHKLDQAVDFVPRGGMGATSQAQIRAFLLSQGIDVKESLGPGDKGHSDHFHAAFGRRRLSSDQVSGRQERASAKATRETEKAARDAAKAIADLDRDYESLGRQLDPLIKAQNAYNDQLDRIARLQKAGRLDVDAGNALRLEAGINYSETIDKIEEDAREKIIKGLSSGFETVAGEPLSRLGDALEAVLSDSAARVWERMPVDLQTAFQGLSGLVDTISSAGRRGGLRDLAGSITSPPSAEAAKDPFVQGMETVFRPIRDGLDDLLGELGGIFGDRGSFTRALGRAAGFAQVGGTIGGLIGGRGSAAGGAVGGVLGGIAGEAMKGAITKGIGGALGKTLGNAAGPLGSLIGSLAGSFLGKALTKSKTGSASISSVTGDATLGGNSASMKSGAGSAAKGVQDALSSIAEQLGGTIGGFNVSVGLKDGKFRVDPSGKGATKTKKGAVDFGKDERAAISFAIGDAISDGAIQGLSKAVRAALGSSKDVERAMKEALKVRDLEDLIGGVGDKLGRVFKDFDRIAADRVRIAKQYGLDLVAVERVNGEERAKIVEDLIKKRIGGLVDFQNEMKFGDLFEGDAATRRTALLGEIGKFQPLAEAGNEEAADKLVDLFRRLLGTSEEAFGTAGPELSADRALAASGVDRVIKMENERIEKAKAQQQTQTDALVRNNVLTDETNAILARQTTLLGTIAGALSGGSGGGPGDEFGLAHTTRETARV